MITHMMVHQLDDGQIPLFDFHPADLVYTFDPGRLNEPPTEGELAPRRVYEGSFWQSVSGGYRVLVPLAVDLTLSDLSEQIEGWLKWVHDDPGCTGTLVVVIRSRYHISSEGTFFHGGFAFVPQPMGVRLEGACPAETVRRILVTTDADLPYQTPLVRDVLSTFLAPMRTLSILECDFELSIRSERTDRYEDRARRLLYEHLSVEQIADLEEDEAFYVEGADQQTYRIEARPQHNVFLVGDQRQKLIEFCIVLTECTPIYDLLLTQKFLLESSPETFYAKANRWEIQPDGSKTFVYMSLPDPEQHLPVGSLWGTVYRNILNTGAVNPTATNPQQEGATP